MPLSAAERSKRYREKLKENPEKRNVYLEKARKRAAKSKKHITDMTDRDKRYIRKKWRLYQHKSRQLKKVKAREREIIEEFTPPATPEHNYNEVEDRVQGNNRSSGRRRVRRNKTSSYRKIKKLEEELEKLNKTAAKYKKRYERAKQKLKGTKKAINILTPNSKATADTEGYDVPETVKKQLVFHNALVNQMKENYGNSSNEHNKQVISGILEGDILKKYHVQTIAKKKVGCYSRKKKSEKGSRTRNKHSLHNKIRNFFCRDDNTVLTPGKKQTITRGKIKHQKRLLKDNLKVLYEKFCKETSGKVSFATFCRHKPYFIVRPKLTDRDSCLCKRHSNLQFKLDVFKKLKLSEEANIERLCSAVVCSVDSKDCMFNKCQQCKDKEAIPEEKIKDENKIVKWFAWKVEKYEKVKQNKKFIISKTVKVEESGKLKDLCLDINHELKSKFCAHVFRKNFQTSQRQKCILELAYDEAVLHIDFSENYLCKLNSEIQSMHFGSSHNQASLHTVVIYTENENPKSVCTISSSKRHDPSAIWAHLKPILEGLRSKGVETVHFFSDGPVTQYRNKDNFYFLRTFFLEMGFANATWNFSEPSHGKGAPDGVGAAVKRVADGLVCKGIDIPDAETLYNELLGNVNVELFYIPESTITELDNKKESGGSTVIKGIMKINQIVLKCNKKPVLYGRELSCFCKKFPIFCKCFDIVEIISESGNSSTSTTTNKPDHKADDGHPWQLEIGNWIIVKYENNIYPGKITDTDTDDQTIEVEVLHSIGFNKYVWPAKEDKIWYHEEDVLYTTEPPINISKRILSFPDPFWVK